MKLTKKNLNHLCLLILLGAVIGTLCWELLERFLILVEKPLSLTIGPIGFDFRVLIVKIMINPGSVVGIGGSILLFKSI